MAFTPGLGSKHGFSLEVGGVISDVVASTYSDLTLIVLGATGKKDILMLSPFLSMLALCSISSIRFAINNSVANKGWQIHRFCLVVLIRMIGTLLAFVVATHLFMTAKRQVMMLSLLN